MVGSASLKWACYPSVVCYPITGHVQSFLGPLGPRGPCGDARQWLSPNVCSSEHFLCTFTQMPLQDACHLPSWESLQEPRVNGSRAARRSGGE